MNQNNLQNNQNDPTFNLRMQSTAENAASNINNYNVVADSSDNISSTFYTNHYSDQQSIYNDNIPSTLPPVSSPCVPGPQQQTIENTTFPFNSFNMNSVNPSQSEIHSFDIPEYKIIVIPFPLNSFNMNSNNPSQSGILSFDIPGYKIIIIPTFSQQDNTCLNYSSSDISNTQFTQFQQ
ncbi:uncharacterized protein OCT59_013243 [Rhizophagus irregularis]|uniref:Uncharacterized protein n=2 Tax=Rhizophagus irregularis TaxID=588596 RepID=A0A015LHZ7_RHIIW|nr:hypothetical protein RirG_070990 [Rhizophagus irregularis DAOM 197198w]UZO20831.1 hypothetical protein OCT59_013243 [Rhizophagus irregularis]GBC27694.1 hypothetical protein GLOIN_2v114023 [Rhizophagus irregularis DAOM 181602=DAOM 197198]CAG8629750.1 3177_t:CDS:1 [Rhizophagus irregularis]